MAVSWDLVVPFCVVIVLYWLYKSIKSSAEIAKFYAKFPSPPMVPVFGNALDFRVISDFLKVITKYQQTYGNLFGVKFGVFRRLFFISDYEWLKFLLSTNKVMDKMDTYKYLENWLGEGLLLSPGNRKWEQHRKMLNPAFHFKILENFVEIFESAGNILVRKLKNKGNQESFDVAPYITLCTLDIICESAMGTSVHAQENEMSEYVKSVKQMCKIIIERTINPMKGLFPIYFLSGGYHAEMRYVKTLHDYTDKVIVSRREEILQNKSLQNGENTKKRRKVFLDLLLEPTVDGLLLTNKEIREEVDTFMFAGHDTTASAIGFILYCLANHQEVQHLALKEQEGIFGPDKNPSVTYAHLQEMRYLEQVIKESLRLYPSVPMYGRKTSRDVEFDGITIPEGIELVVFVPGIHKNPELYPDPEKFDPERFQNDDNRLPYSYLSFSAGPRSCIGKKFAYLEMKSVVSNIIRNFKLSPAVPVHNLDLSFETVMISLNGIKIGFAARN